MVFHLGWAWGFPRKNLMSIIFIYFHWNLVSWRVTNTLSEQGLSLFPETAENLSTQFTPSCIYVLSNLAVSMTKPTGVTLFSVPWLKFLISKILEFANLFNDLIYNNLEVPPLSILYIN